MIVLDNSFDKMDQLRCNAAMNPAATLSHATVRAAWPVWLAGALALAVAMGVGRFAFTPLLPLMQREGLVGEAGGAALAAVNYAGYLLGALSAARLAARPRRLVLASLLATVLVTLAAGLVQSVAAWLLLRCAAGVFSAWVMVGVSAWAMGELARRGRPELGGRVYAGVGLGILLAGGLAWWRAGDGAAALWLQLGLLALPAVLVVALAWPREVGAAATAATRTGPAETGGHRGLVLSYGLFGFGYILPATYLPAMARALVDDPRLFGLAWPAFGAAAALSTLATGWALRRHLARVWSVCHGMLAVGAALPLLSRSGPAIGAAALAVGGSFMVATMAGLQLARQRAATNPAPLLSRMVASFAAGQIAGPLLVLLLAQLGVARSIEATLALAALLLLLSAVWLYRQSTPVSAENDDARTR